MGRRLRSELAFDPFRRQALFPCLERNKPSSRASGACERAHLMPDEAEFRNPYSNFSTN